MSALALAVTVLALFATVPATWAASLDAKADAAAFLVSRQKTDGGFGEAGRPSDPSLTAWVVLALAASGRDPATVHGAYASGVRAADEVLAV